MRLISAAATLILAIPSALCATTPKQEAAAIAATPTQIAESIGVQGLDDLDPAFVISTQPFLIPRENQDDQFLRAYVNKRTGKTEIQIYVWQRYTGQAINFNEVNYETPDGPVSASVDNLGVSGIDCGRYSCSQREDVIFTVPESLLRHLSADAQAGTAASWRYKLSGRVQRDEPTRQMLKTEIAGLLIKLDQVRSSNHLQGTAPAVSKP